MKIVVSGYVGKKITGIGRWLINLLNNIQSDNEYVVYTNYDMKDVMAFSNSQVTIKTYGVSKLSSIGNLLWTTFVFPFVGIKEKADIVLIPNFTLLLLKFKPTIVIIHDLIEYNVKNKFSPTKMFYRTKIADPLMAKRSDKIITVSENSKNDIITYLNVSPEKITVVYSGVDQEKFHKMGDDEVNDIFAKKGWPKDFILYAGTIDHPGKNAMAVIKAYEDLKETSRYCGQLILAGMPGAGYEIVKQYIAQSAYQNQIVLTGFVTDEELIALYSKCDTFAFVSHYEGFGLPPLEALACGAKVVVSSTSSLPEVVGNVGLSVDPADQKAINDAIFESIKKPTNSDYKRLVAQHLVNYELPSISKQVESVMTDLKAALK